MQKLHPIRIYLYSWYTFNHMYNTEIITGVREVRSWLVGYCNACTKSSNKWEDFGSIECWPNKERLITFLSYQNLKRWGSASPTPYMNDTAFFTLSMGGFNTPRMKWTYHTMIQKKPSTWPQYKPSEDVFSVYQERYLCSQTRSQIPGNDWSSIW